MLIRSQDKEKQTDTSATTLMIKTGKNYAKIVGLTGKGDSYITLGTYSEKKTAVDVMDMIEEFERCKMTIFDMPQNV